MDKKNFLIIINIVALIAVLVVNFLANALPINGKNTGEISDRFDVLFKPAGYAFSIWGIIYLALILFAIYQALPAQRENGLIENVGIWFAVSCLLNIGWLFAWHHEKFLLTIFLMFLLLASLITIYVRLNINMSDSGPLEYWLAHVPFSLYLGWICVATLANATIYLTSVQWSGWGISPTTWYLILLLLGLILLFIFVFKRNDVIPGVVILWATIAVAVSNASATSLISTSSWIAAGLSSLLVIVGIVRSWQMN